MAHGRRFRKLAEERLADRFRVLAPDLRGHGRSGWDPPWNIAVHAADVLDTTEVRPATWIGHSFGGRLVLELAAARPELVERAVLLDPAIQLDPAHALQRAEEERDELTFVSIDEATAWRRGGAPRTPLEILEEEMREHLVDSPDGRFRFRYCASAVVAMYGELAAGPPAVAPRSPVLVVVGAETDVVSRAQLADLRGVVGDLLEVATVPGGHMVLWEAFAETTDAIDTFLASTDGG